MKSSPFVRRFFHVAVAVVALCVFAAVAQMSAEARPASLNVGNGGIAVQGYDPVAYFTENKPVMGSTSFAVKYKGATYQFSSKANRDKFVAAPEKYTPAFGGFCAYGVCQGKTVDIDPKAFAIVEGRLLMMKDTGARDAFLKDKKKNLAEAESRWPRISGGQGGTTP